MQLLERPAHDPFSNDQPRLRRQNQPFQSQRTICDLGVLVQQGHRGCQLSENAQGGTDVEHEVAPSGFCEQLGQPNTGRALREERQSTALQAVNSPNACVRHVLKRRHMTDAFAEGRLE